MIIISLTPNIIHIQVACMADIFRSQYQWLPYRFLSIEELPWSEQYTLEYPHTLCRYRQTWCSTPQKATLNPEHTFLLWWGSGDDEGHLRTPCCVQLISFCRIFRILVAHAISNETPREYRKVVLHPRKMRVVVVKFCYADRFNQQSRKEYRNCYVWLVNTCI